MPSISSVASSERFQMQLWNPDGYMIEHLEAQHSRGDKLVTA